MEETPGPNQPADECLAVIARRKRTKSVPTQPPSSSSSSEFSSCATTEEEEDMANCLILLAQGRSAAPSGKFTTRTSGKAGFYVYKCKTCSKCFPSFQALGGHRASHKKPKFSPAPAPAPPTIDEDSIQLSINSFSEPPDPAPAAAAGSGGGSGSGKQKVHECSICGSEFSSGQALGGHMRRHRPSNIAEQPPEARKEKSPLSLDLNLPAPSDEDHHHQSGGGELRRPLSSVSAGPPTAFAFSTKAQLILPSASALVDCPY
ncbi:Zinc finger protein ZAT5 [Apostasia shenzhenica]|uniref:Zinc finger protein ZAT5 n=1 Tax=Apostasia shenzhenica TaxID=1088818 RepID=A0A2I0AV18_9ASPA|nr:Zinc finger protein ZAT5 [Apostasia shenzhenica]